MATGIQHSYQSQDNTQTWTSVNSEKMLSLMITDKIKHRRMATKMFIQETLRQRDVWACFASSESINTLIFASFLTLFLSSYLFIYIYKGYDWLRLWERVGWGSNNTFWFKTSVLLITIHMNFSWAWVAKSIHSFNDKQRYLTVSSSLETFSNRNVLAHTFTRYIVHSYKISIALCLSIFLFI